METGITSATGSALVELGHTKVLAEVIGPTTNPNNYLSSNGNNLITTANNNPNMEEGTLECHVTYIPQVGFPITALVAATPSSLSDQSSSSSAQPILSSGRIRTHIAALEQELSSQLQASISAAVPLQTYPKHWIVVHVTILQDDGSVLSACTTAASLALVDASVEVYDMITSSTVAVVFPNNKKINNNNKATSASKTTTNATTATTTTTTSSSSSSPSSSLLLLADPTYAEMAHADAIVTLSMLANWKEVTLWNQAGRLSSTTANAALSLCRDGCRTMHKFMKNTLLLDDSGGGGGGGSSRDSGDNKEMEVPQQEDVVMADGSN